MNRKMKVFLPALGWEGRWMNNVMRMEGNGIGCRTPESVSQIHHCVIFTSYLWLSYPPVKMEVFFPALTGLLERKT